MGAIRPPPQALSEFVPSSNPNQLSITELVSPMIELLETGVALPAAVELTAADLGTDALPGTLERLEGMRVSVAQSVVVAPSGGSINERDALSFGDGVFHVVLPQIARPFREPGIGVMDAALATLPAGKNPPLFDTNPERLMVRSRAQIGANPLSVDSGAQVAGLIGVLDYFAGTWALLPDVAAPPTVSGGRLPEAVNDADYDAVTIASFNLLRFFDEVSDGNGAVTLTPEALADCRSGQRQQPGGRRGHGDQRGRPVGATARQRREAAQGRDRDIPGAGDQRRAASRRATDAGAGRQRRREPGRRRRTGRLVLQSGRRQR